MNAKPFMRCAVVFFGFVLTSAAAQSLPGILAGPFTNAVNGHVYCLLEPASWSSAQAAAVQLGGQLATINDADEDAWVFSSFIPYRGSAGGFWIGLTDAASEGTFVWADGDTSAYRNWGPDEPNNFSNEDYGCYFAVGPYLGKWNDCGDWHEPHPGIVEISRPILRVDVASIQLTWNSSTNRRYQIQYAITPATNAWSNWGMPIEGEDTRTHFLIGTLHQPRAIFRVIELPR